jgi:hypothetical protein
MKMPFLALVSATLGALAAASEPAVAPPLPEMKFGVPRLSLSPDVTSNLPAVWGTGREWLRNTAPAAVAQKKYVSRMPIVVPRAEVDAELLVRPPDSTKHFTGIVKARDIDSGK